MNPLKLEDYPARSADKLRFGDTDRQGHVNNVVFATLLETGRVEVLDRLGLLAARDGVTFVIARLCIDFRREIFWPGTVHCGSAITKIGRSSIAVVQGLFQDGVCVATAETVVVQVDARTHGSTPLDQEARDKLAPLLVVP